MKYAIGIMSGTSADGVSLTLASFRNRSLELHHYKTFPYPSRLRGIILRGPHLTAPEISRLNIFLGEFYTQAILHFLKKTRFPKHRISVIGSHGQTIYHGPCDKPRNTLQIGEPSIIAERTGIPVVADFRMGDIAAGGEGAPLIPFFDKFFFGNGPVRAMQNIGGIANVTVVGKSCRTIAFDNGPGNCLIDWAVRKFTKGRKQFDAYGKMAERGGIHMRAVLDMTQHAYFRKKPPKSTGRELFNERFIPKLLLKQKKEDILATLTYFTAFSIHNSFRRFIRYRVRELIISGGGVYNQTLMNHLKDLFAPTLVRSIEAYGIPAQAKEPLAFSFFALRTLEGKINHLPSTTGAHRSVILGKMNNIMSSNM